MGRLEDAEPLLRESLEIMRKALGAEHPIVGASLNNMGTLLKALGRLEEAEPLLRQSLEIKHNPKLKESLESLRKLLQDMGRFEDAGALTAA